MKSFSLFNTTSNTDANAPMTRGVAVSSTNVYYSGLISGSVELSLQLAWTGDPTGTIVIQGSNKQEPDVTSDDDWFDITPTDAPDNPAGSAADTSATVNDVNCKFKRVKYTNASGSGVLSGDAAVGKQM